MVTKHLMQTVTVFLVFILATATQAVFIGADYNGFTSTELVVLKDSVKEWADLLPCSDGKKVPIEFVCDNNLSSLGLAEVWFKADGDVDHARVTLDNDGLYWTLTDPASWSPGHENHYDALSVAKHEVGHALGFIHGGNFMDSVVVVSDNRFYDMNNDFIFNDNDFDLQDGADWDGHAASNTDLLYWQLPPKTRRHPTLHHAQVLGDAYGYCVVPEPVSVILGLLGLGTAVSVLRRRKALS